MGSNCLLAFGLPAASLKLQCHVWSAQCLAFLDKHPLEIPVRQIFARQLRQVRERAQEAVGHRPGKTAHATAPFGSRNMEFDGCQVSRQAAPRDEILKFSLPGGEHPHALCLLPFQVR